MCEYIVHKTVLDAHYINPTYIHATTTDGRINIYVLLVVHASCVYIHKSILYIYIAAMDIYACCVVHMRPTLVLRVHVPTWCMVHHGSWLILMHLCIVRITHHAHSPQTAYICTDIYIWHTCVSIYIYISHVTIRCVCAPRMCAWYMAFTATMMVMQNENRYTSHPDLDLAFYLPVSHLHLPRV